MKKVLCAVLSVLMLTQLAVISLASYIYESQDGSFTIELPDDFDEVEEMKFIGDDDSNIGVTIEEYTEDTKDYCVDSMTDEQVKERAALIEEVSYLAFASVNREGSMEVVSAEKVKHSNGFSAFVVTLKSTAKTADGETVLYQKIYEFTAEDHIYNFTYTAHKDGGPDDMDKSFESIVINEAERLSPLHTFTKKGVPALIIFGIVVLGIIRFIRPPKIGVVVLNIIQFIRPPEKRKKGKLK